LSALFFDGVGARQQAIQDREIFSSAFYKLKKFF